MLLHVPGLCQDLNMCIDGYCTKKEKERGQGNFPNVAGDLVASNKAAN